jgi:hypothetical protein
MINAKVYENRLRRMAERQGLKVIKSRRRDPHAIGYGTYWIVDPTINGTVAGDSNVGLSLAEVEDHLMRREPADALPRLSRR